jgi:hypothetical protein
MHPISLNKHYWTYKHRQTTHNNSMRLQYPTHTNRKVIQIKNQQRNFRINQYYKSNRLNQHLHNIHLAAVQYTFFSAVHRTFSKIGHILEYKANIRKLRYLLVYQTTMENKPTIQQQKKLQKMNTWRLDNMFLNKQ